MFKYAPKYAWLERRHDQGEIRRHALAHALGSRIVVWHDCELCTSTINLSTHPDALFRNVYPQGRRVDKEDLKGRPHGWDPQSGRYFRE